MEIFYIISAIISAISLVAYRLWKIVREYKALNAVKTKGVVKVTITSREIIIEKKGNVSIKTAE